MAMTKLQLQEELQTKQLIVSALLLTAQRIVNLAEAEAREVTASEQATIAGLLQQIENINGEAQNISAKLERWGY